MNTQYTPIERYSIEVAQHDAIRLFNETDVRHIVETIRDGVFIAVPVPVQTDAPSAAPIVPTISFAEMMQTTYAANWLIDGLIEQTDLGLIFGASGSGKTFVALDMAYCIAAGIPYHGRNTHKTGVLYVCGEGHSGLQKRLRAIHLEKGGNDSFLPIHTTKVPAAFIDRNSTITIQNTVNAIGNIGLVIVDTFHRNLGDGDENSAKDIAKFLQNIDLYLRSSGIAVVVVHHSGHDSNGRSRGSSSIRGAMDAEYEIIKESDSDILTVINHKLKNFEKNKPFSFKFKPVEDSVVLEPMDYVAKPKVKALSNNALIALRCLDKVIEQYGISPPQIVRDEFPDSPQNIPTKVVTIEQWRVLVYQSITVDSEPEKKQHALKSAFQRCRKDI